MADRLPQEPNAGLLEVLPGALLLLFFLTYAVGGLAILLLRLFS